MSAPVPHLVAGVELEPRLATTTLQEPTQQQQAQAPVASPSRTRRSAARGHRTRACASCAYSRLGRQWPVGREAVTRGRIAGQLPGQPSPGALFELLLGGGPPAKAREGKQPFPNETNSTLPGTPLERPRRRCVVHDLAVVLDHEQQVARVLTCEARCGLSATVPYSPTTVPFLTHRAAGAHSTREEPSSSRACVCRSAR